MLTFPCLGMYGKASLARASVVEGIGRELAQDVTVDGIAG
jgi:hypothetical protein